MKKDHPWTKGFHKPHKRNVRSLEKLVKFITKKERNIKKSPSEEG